jgi:hypothetical protein
MNENLTLELAALPQLRIADLRRRYLELFGEPTRAANKTWLVKRLAWRLQALAEGDLSQRARQRAAELANDADLRVAAPRKAGVRSGPAPSQPAALRPSKTRERLPPPGTILRRPYKGALLQVQILQRGCQFEGRIYPSLSALAKAITGSHCSGFLFFGLTAKRGAS